MIANELKEVCEIQEELAKDLNIISSIIIRCIRYKIKLVIFYKRENHLWIPKSKSIIMNGWFNDENRAVNL